MTHQTGDAIRRFIQSALCACALGLLAGPLAAKGPTVAERRAEIRKTSDATLAQLYKVQPGAKQPIERSAGYATFSNFGMRLMVVGGGKGEGVALHRNTRAATFMRMIEVQAGIGFGVKQVRQVWVFGSQAAFETFVQSGWEIGAEASVSAESGGTGVALEGAVSIAKDVWLYQLTDNGPTLALAAKGTRYYKNDELN